MNLARCNCLVQWLVAKRLLVPLVISTVNLLQVHVHQGLYRPLNLRVFVCGKRSFRFHKRTAEGAGANGSDREPSFFQYHPRRLCRRITGTIATHKLQHSAEFVVVEAKMSFILSVDTGPATATPHDEFVMLLLRGKSFGSRVQRNEFGQRGPGQGPCRTCTSN